jgi:UDP-glucose 4-epimerase
MKITDSMVVVTGGAGFIGSHLVDRLLDLGNRVRVIDDFSSGKLTNLAQWENDPRLEIENVSILNEDALRQLMQGSDFIFHLATLNVRRSLLQPTSVHQVNTTGTLNVLKAATAAKVHRLLYCSSSEVNGTARVTPLPEEYNFQPETIYGASKLAGEYYSLVFSRAGWLPVTVARPHNNYGPRAHFAGDLGEVIPKFILRALAGLPPVIYGDGQQTRDFTFVTETADFLVRLLECDKALGRVVNICRGKEVKVLEIAQQVSELTGLDQPPTFLPGRPSDVLRLWGDYSRLNDLLGDIPKIDIHDGLTQCVDWYRENVEINQKLLDSLEPKSWDRNEPEWWMENSR